MTYYIIRLAEVEGKPSIEVFDGFEGGTDTNIPCKPKWVMPTQCNVFDSFQLRGCGFVEYPAALLSKVRNKYPNEFGGATFFSEYEFIEYLNKYPEVVDTFPSLVGR